MEVAPATVGAEPTIPEIAGLNTHSGLRYAGGKAGLYLQLLQRFAHDYADFTATFQSLMVAENWEAATRQAHTLKGLCGSLGAHEARPLAATLEKTLQARDALAAHSALASADAVVSALVSALLAHFGHTDAPKPPLGGEGATTKGFTAWLPELRELLRLGDNDARDLWKSREPEINAQLPFHVAQRVSLALSNYEFDAALALLPDDTPKAG